MRHKFVILPLTAALLALPSAASAGATFHEAEAIHHAAPLPRDGRWWTIFGDAELDELVPRGLAQNGDIAVAAARVSLARAALRGAEAERMPRIGGIASVAGQSGTLINAAGGTGSLFELGAGASWEVDLLGRLPKNARATRLDARAAATLLDGARLIAAADIAQTYFILRALDAEGDALDRAAGDAREAVTIAEHRLENGLGTTLDIERLRGELGSIEADRAALDRQRAAAAHALALLVGEEGPVTLGQWSPTPVPEIPAGLPSEMLARRPDVAASMDAIDAARLRVRATETSWFPSISLTGNGGQASTSLADLVRSTASSFGFNLLFSLPIFDGGRHKAAVRKSRAELELETARNRQTVLGAFREVEDQLSAVRLLAEEEAAATRAAEADAHAQSIAEQRFANGAISRLDLIDVRRRALAGARRLSQIRGARYAAAVNLIRALGGGWNETTTAPALARADMPGGR